MTIFLIIMAFASAILAAKLYHSLILAKKELEIANSKRVPEEESRAAWEKFKSDKAKIQKELDSIRKGMESRVNELREQIETYESKVELSELGFRKILFTYEDPKSYQEEVEKIEEEISMMLKSGLAATCTINWTIEGSQAQGKAMISKLLKLAIRTFNADTDAAIARVKWNNLRLMEDRIYKSEESIEKSLDKWGIKISDNYLNLKIRILKLTYEQAELQNKIKEEQRELKEAMREEEKARKEAEKAKSDAEKEERKIQEAIAKAKEAMAVSNTADMTKHIMKIKELELKLAQVGDIKLRAISMAQLTKSGHVYIISNIGSFGEGVLKIGMTRRLEPMDRIWELSDASVPFDFDVHAMIKCDDAPALESLLHEKFSERRLNLVNDKKEFFNVTLTEVQNVITENGYDVKLSLLAEAREYNESEQIRKGVK